MEWTQDDTQTAVRMKMAGKSAREIAAVLGKTRSAVIGKIWRRGLSEKRRVRIVNESHDAPTPRRPSVPPIRHKVCQYPEDDNCREFCAKPVVPNKPYCREHCDVAYRGRVNLEELYDDSKEQSELLPSI